MKSNNRQFKAEETVWVIVVAILFALAVGFGLYRGAEASEIAADVREISRQPYRDMETGECVWPENGYPWATVNAHDVNVRTGPGLNHDVLFQVGYGCAVEVINMKNGWVQCYYWTCPGKPVWICGQYLDMR